MGFFDDLTESLTSAGKDVTQKAKDMSGIDRITDKRGQGRHAEG